MPFPKALVSSKRNRCGQILDLELGRTWDLARLITRPDLELGRTWDSTGLGIRQDMELDQTWNSTGLRTWPALELGLWTQTHTFFTHLGFPKEKQTTKTKAEKSKIMNFFHNNSKNILVFDNAEID